MDAKVEVEQRGEVGVVTLSNPEKRNALTSELLEALVSALEGLEGVRAAVVTGGTEVFASGADLRTLLDLDPDEYRSSPRAGYWRRLNAIELPLVAATAGWVLGGGCELAFLCDLVVAGDTSVFGQPEVRLGLLPGAGGTQRWARAAGRFVAADVILAGRTFDAFEARDLGLVARVVPSERVVEAAVDTAGQIARGAPLALLAARASVRAAEELPLSDGLEHERDELFRLLATEDRREGITAFLEKRPPKFEGR
jgi:enoyl-CoA hydratase/carnithine racemase